jgi:hypothetical protein
MLYLDHCEVSILPYEGHKVSEHILREYNIKKIIHNCGDGTNNKLFNHTVRH